MDNDLYTYLQKRFLEDNHKSKHKYFKEWVENLVETQIYYFTKDMIKTYKK
jgi:hypothetical protein